VCPFSEDWDNAGKENDEFNRFVYGIPPSKGKADFAFIQHMIACLNETGRAGIVASQGVLFRGHEEQKIRRTMILGDEQNHIEGDIVEAVIALPPSVFYGTQIPGCVLILNKNKPRERKNKILFYYAAHKDDYLEQPNRNILREEDIERISDALKNYTDIPRKCHIADLDEIKENEFNLNVPRYVDISEPEEEIDIQNTIDELKKLEKERQEIENKVQQDLKELGLKV